MGQLRVVRRVNENDVALAVFRVVQRYRHALEARHRLWGENLVLGAIDDHQPICARLKADFFWKIGLRAGAGDRDVFAQQGAVRQLVARFAQAGSEEVFHPSTARVDLFCGDEHSLSRLLFQEINILFHGLPAELRAIKKPLSGGHSGLSNALTRALHH